MPIFEQARIKDIKLLELTRSYPPSPSQGPGHQGQLSKGEAGPLLLSFNPVQIAIERINLA
jgi:hypothetical protein